MTEFKSLAEPSFSWRQQWIFTLKELRETLRDRRTIITLLAMPLLLYPLLGLGFRFLAFQQLARGDQQYQIAVNTDREAQWLADLMLLSESSIESDDVPPVQVFLPGDRESLDIEGLVAEGRADIGFRLADLTDSSDSANLPRLQIEMLVNQNLMRSNQAADYLHRRFEAAGNELIRRWLETRQIPYMPPIESQRIIVQADTTGSAALSLLPLILLLMTVTGGVYPAIDLTAGERERNTLEVLVCLPVPKIRLLLAKFVAVVTVTMLTGLMNLAAMSVTLYSLQLDSALLGPQGLTFGLCVKLFCVLTTFALFYSAILLFLTSSARSFKEAQAYLIPLLLLSLAPGLVIMLPGWNLWAGTAVLPVFNILLVSRELLMGQATLFPALLALLSTIVYGLVGLALAAKVFGTDAVAVGGRSPWSDLFRRPTSIGDRPSLALVFGGLAALFPSYFIASGLLSRQADFSPSLRLGLSSLLTICLFAGIPWLLLRWQRVSLRRGLALENANWNHWIGGFMLGLGTWPLVFEIVVLSQSVGLHSLDSSRFKMVEELLQGWTNIPLPMILLAMAVVPGICEEIFFRGFLFNGLRTALSGRVTIVVTAVTFGLFHLILAGGLTPERLIPSILMGFLLGWVRWHSSSLLPGMLVHVVHNASLLTLAQFREELAGWGLGGQFQSHLPLAWIVTSLAITLTGAFVMQFPLRRTLVN